MKKEDVRKQLADKFLAAIEEEPLKWKQKFTSPYIPENGIYGNRYTGLNRLILLNEIVEKGYTDPRFYSQSYIFGSEENRQKKWDDPTKIKVIKGEKPILIESKFYVPNKREYELKPISPVTYWDLPKEEQDKYHPVRKANPVYNGQQLTGIKEYEFSPIEITEERIKGYLDKAVENMGVKIKEDVSVDVPCYIPFFDEIELPSRELFNSEYDYYTTKLHEISHSTGHESRLNREFKNNDMKKYAMEELRAEISTCFIAGDLKMDISNTSYEKNHIAYIQNWQSVIGEEPDALIDAIYAAEEIADYVLEKAEYKEKDKENKRELAMEQPEKREKPPKFTIDKNIGKISADMQRQKSVEIGR